MIKKTVKVGDRIVDLRFYKDTINISVWEKDETLPMGYRYIQELDVKTDQDFYGVRKK